MTEYEYAIEIFDKNEETVRVPDEAIGVTVDYFGDLATVQCLLPVEE